MGDGTVAPKATTFLDNIAIVPDFNAGGYISSTGSTPTLASMQYSNAIILNFGEELSVECNGVNSNVAVLSRWTADDKYIETLEVGVGNVESTYTYTASRDVERIKNIMPNSRAIYSK